MLVLLTCSRSHMSGVFAKSTAGIRPGRRAKYCGVRFCRFWDAHAGGGLAGQRKLRTSDRHWSPTSSDNTRYHRRRTWMHSAGRPRGAVEAPVFTLLPPPCYYDVLRAARPPAPRPFRSDDGNEDSAVPRAEDGTRTRWKGPGHSNR